MLSGVIIFNIKNFLLCFRCIGSIDSAFYSDIQNIFIYTIGNIHLLILLFQTPVL